MPNFAPYSNDAPSPWRKAGAAVAGFLAFYALAIVLGGLIAALEEALGAMAGVVGAIAALAVLAAAGFWMMRSLRDKRPGARGAFSWFALGFVAAMVVFGGCLMLISGI